MHNMAPKLPQYFYLLMEKPIGCSFHVQSPYHQATQCSQKTYTCILIETRLTPMDTSPAFQCHGDISQFQPSKFTSAVGNCRGFCRSEQCFYSNHLGKNIAVQFLILISWHNYRLQTRDITCTCYRSVWPIIYFWRFIHPLSLRSCGNGTSFPFGTTFILFHSFTICSSAGAKEK